MRTKNCRRIADRKCLAVEEIRLDFLLSGIQFGNGQGIFGSDRLDDFAAFDGFESWPEMAAFFRGHSKNIIDSFQGWHIRWLPLPPTLADV